MKLLYSIIIFVLLYCDADMPTVLICSNCFIQITRDTVNTNRQYFIDICINVGIYKLCSSFTNYYSGFMIGLWESK